MTRWAVVGASGFVGSAIVRHGRSVGYEVREVPAPRIRAAGSTVAGLTEDLVEADQSVEELAREFVGCDVVINAAGIPDADASPSPELMGANALLPTIVGRAAERAGVGRYLHISSATVQGHAKVLSESEQVAPFSAYSVSKALGEQLLLRDGTQPPSMSVVRAVSVQSRSRRTTERLIQLAQSPLASVARSSTGPAPLSLIENTAAAITFVASAGSAELARVILLPGDGLSVRDVLTAFGARRITTLPDSVARAVVGVASLAGRWLPRMAAEARRAEMLWFGQASEASWLADHGFVPPVGREGWTALARDRDTVPRPRLLAMVTIAPSVRHFLGGQLGYLQSHGFDVSVLSSPGDDLVEIAERDQVTAVPFPMARGISPLQDLRDLGRMVRLLRTMRPDLVTYGTPKASLLGGIGAWLTRVPVRVYTLHGLRLETTTGLRRAVLYLTEWVTCHTAHVVICVSPSLRSEAVELRLVEPRRAVVLGSGSCNGVEVSRFSRSAATPSRVSAIRASLGWPADGPVVGFVGRLTRDKGIPELIDSFRSVRERVPGVRLLLVGDFEEGDPVPSPVRREIARSTDIAVTGMLPDPADHFHLLDVLALPTYREGFGDVIIEAAVAEVPSVATWATGVRDAVVNGVTGILVPIGDSAALADALVLLLSNGPVADSLAHAARSRAVEHYESTGVWERTASLYGELVAKRLSASTRASVSNNTEESGQL